jgi:hypothetical protein
MQSRLCSQFATAKRRFWSDRLRTFHPPDQIATDFIDLMLRKTGPPGVIQGEEGPDQIGVKISFKDVGVTALS